MTHTKAQLKRLSRAQLVATLMFLLTMLKAENPKAYHAVEKRMGLSRASAHKSKRRGKTHAKKGGGHKKRASPKQAANRRRFAAFIKKHGRAPHKGESL